MTAEKSKGRYAPLDPVILSNITPAPNQTSCHTVRSCVMGDNSDLMSEVAQLWITDDDVVVDMTYGRGIFWKQLPELPHKKYDQLWGDDLRNIPIPDQSADVVVLDPPYRPTHGSKEFTHDMAKGYGNGTQQLDTIEDVLSLYRDGIVEAKRILKSHGRIFVKCQDMTYSHRLHFVTLDILRMLIQYNFELLDQFILAGNTGLKSPRWKNQQRARRTHSVLWIAST